ncbi:MAG TPA: hypothetical protein VF941_03155 [Clostridia bacterium]
MSRTDIYNKFYRNIQSVGSTDANLKTEFNYQLGIYYQLMLAKLKNYKTYISSPFTVGMNAVRTSDGTQVAISTVTSSSTTVTVTTGLAHGFSTNDIVAINNVVPTNVYTGQSPFVGVFSITVTSTTQFTYTISTSQNGVGGTHAQYYPNPPGYVTSDGIVLRVGNINYPLKLVSSEAIWEQLNAVLLQASAVPQFYYPRRDDFGIWPIPQNFYPGTIYYHYRDRNLMVDDYAAGTITATNGSYRIAGTSTAFTAAMVGRWFTIDDTTVPGEGYWYRIVSVDVSNQYLILSQPFTGTTTSGISSYRVCQTPEIPEDLHMYLASGVTGGYYKDIRKDVQTAQMFLNEFYTGDMNNNNRNEDDPNVIGGLIGGIKNYSDREDERVIDRKPGLNPLQFKPFAVTLSS